MSELYNVYCDESCHLENDRQPFMVLGAVWCPVSKRKEIARRLREIRQKHDLNPQMEIKWTSVSPAKLTFYLDILDYFFDDDDLHFRGVIADKSVLNHNLFSQDHDTWYYKMYFTMLKAIFDPQAHYRIYLDIKDTQGGNKVRKLHDALCHNLYDFSHHIVQRVQLVESKHVDLMQLADLLIGTVMYANRGKFNSVAKHQVVKRMQQRSRYNLTRSTLLKENKSNLLKWTPNGGANA
ncbi:DUF3800 domain-containing protein [Endozoicomonas sp. 4G]|uniref:DUF3800 domain-containing protein n=1 Tax=Endozoicomonas sp. 4G TaxID=2872754 RepID=UPI0020790B4D|nr:DUF3800 domain-containing protein [Endozoicomonas sp. 4G]